MTTIEIRLAEGGIRTLELDTPFDEITASEIMSLINRSIHGWREVKQTGDD